MSKDGAIRILIVDDHPVMRVGLAALKVAITAKLHPADQSSIILCFSVPPWCRS
ncbi:MAG: hypothetical protein M3Z04_05925 [Chloroflexota bacterium]|nr:hypothetical protein [Chloroflexota bacterium]